MAVVHDVIVAVYALPCRETEGAYDLFVRCYLPAATLRTHHNQALYQQFERAGYLTIAPGEVNDHRLVEADNQRNVERTAKIEALERRCAELESNVALAAERVKSLEARPDISYEECGTPLEHTDAASS